MTKMISFNMPSNNSIQMMNTEILNNKMMMLMNLIIMIILWISKYNMKNKMINKKMINNQKIELMWTLAPMMMIMLISYLSIITLYLNNEMKLNILTIKIAGNQWFWNYNYMNLKISFNSYMMMKKKFNFNLLETDNKMIVPTNMQIMLIVSSMDVIHSWTIPSMNIKMDAIPNQINSTTTMFNKINVLFGQCSEICGINHSFMPIMVESITLKYFYKWIKNMK